MAAQLAASQEGLSSVRKLSKSLVLALALPVKDKYTESKGKVTVKYELKRMWLEVPVAFFV
jgi:hypothetical protein